MDFCFICGNSTGEIPDAVFLERVAIRFGYQHGLRLTIKVKIVRYYNALGGFLAHPRGLVLPIGNDPTH